MQFNFNGDSRAFLLIFPNAALHLCESIMSTSLLLEKTP